MCPEGSPWGSGGGAAGLVVRRGGSRGPLGNFLPLSVPSGDRRGPSRVRGAAEGIALTAGGGRAGLEAGGGEMGQPCCVPEWRDALLQC